MLCHAMLRYATLRYATLCYTMLCYAMLCYAMLCYAMLCHAMLCYALLCSAGRRPCKSADLCWLYVVPSLEHQLACPKQAQERCIAGDMAAYAGLPLDLER